jgi:hypothetical protein
MTGACLRRDLFGKGLAAFGLAAATKMSLPGESAGHGHHKKRRKRCRHHCKSNRKTCDRGCDILDGDSRDLCKQGCRVAMSQCRGNC